MKAYEWRQVVEAAKITKISLVADRLCVACNDGKIYRPNFAEGTPVLIVVGDYLLKAGDNFGYATAEAYRYCMHPLVRKKKKGARRQP